MGTSLDGSAGQGAGILAYKTRRRSNFGGKAKKKRRRKGGAMAPSKLLAMACFNSPPPHYPSMPRYPKGALSAAGGMRRSEVRTALFSVVGMSCSACAGSIEKAIKRLPGIENAAVDVLNNRAQILFYPNFVNVSCFLSCFFLSFFFFLE